jgi:hypothetical protein
MNGFRSKTFRKVYDAHSRSCGARSEITCSSGFWGNEFHHQLLAAFTARYPHMLIMRDNASGFVFKAINTRFAPVQT